MLGVEQEQHQAIRARGAEGGQVDCTSCDPQALKLEDRIEACDTSPSATMMTIALATLLFTCWSSR
ncbi:hypothetical protein KSC_022480 [Ktedonobacter sp. SOSP1-52]|nr:hypothetical protein KSC_022480 [Ktedonobacter sp. SOSP1-52]